MLSPYLYPDETQVYGSCPPAAVDALSVKISDCIHDVTNWTKSNRLQLNPDKTEAMWCTTSRRRHQLPSTAISIVGAPVIPAHCVCNLLITDDMKWRNQCNSAAAKAMSVLGRIKRTFSALNKETFLILYSTYTRPHLEYCI